MQGMIRCGVLAGCLIACHSSDPVGPDSGSPDGPTGPAGMHVAWKSLPPTWPGAISNGIQIDNATFLFDNLKVIGDAGPGDDRTTADSFQLHWDSMAMPATIDFADAPTGVYSKVAFQIDGHLIQSSYKLHGHVTINSLSVPFEIEDREALSLSLQCNRTLAPGGSVTVDVALDFGAALTSIDWAKVHMDDNGTLELDTTDSQMPAFRNKFATSFSIDNSGPN
jgi:hypothetical protein